MNEQTTPAPEGIEIIVHDGPPAGPSALATGLEQVLRILRGLGAKVSLRVDTAGLGQSVFRSLRAWNLPCEALPKRVSSKLEAADVYRVAYEKGAEAERQRQARGGIGGMAFPDYLVAERKPRHEAQLSEGERQRLKSLEQENIELKQRLPYKPGFVDS